MKNRKMKNNKTFRTYQIDENNIFYDMPNGVMETILEAKKKLNKILSNHKYDGTILSEEDEKSLMSFTDDEKQTLGNLFRLEVFNQEIGFMNADKGVIDRLLLAETCPLCVVDKFAELSVSSIQFVKQTFFRI